jgi:hypothetical protein
MSYQGAGLAGPAVEPKTTLGKIAEGAALTILFFVFGGWMLLKMLWKVLKEGG